MITAGGTVNLLIQDRYLIHLLKYLGKLLLIRNLYIHIPGMVGIGTHEIMNIQLCKLLIQLL